MQSSDRSWGMTQPGCAGGAAGRAGGVRLAACRVLRISPVLALLAISSACAYVPNYFREDGPATSTPLQSPSEADLRARYQPAGGRDLSGAVALRHESGVVRHWPLYFEDPFVDKGHGRTDQTDPLNVHRVGWEDGVAVPYNAGRFVLNTLLLPASAVVTPPVTVQESDGRISRQLLGYDHDAESLGYIWTEPNDLRPIIAQREARQAATTQPSAGSPAAPGSPTRATAPPAQAAPAPRPPQSTPETMPQMTPLPG